LYFEITQPANLGLAMSDETLQKLTDLLVRGVAPETAVAMLSSEGRGHQTDLRTRYMVPMPDLATLPTAQCLAAHLPQDRNPTRAEVQSAIAKCQKEAH
jgi:hypothetical protein